MYRRCPVCESRQRLVARTCLLRGKNLQPRMAARHRFGRTKTLGLSAGEAEPVARMIAEVYALSLQVASPSLATLGLNHRFPSMNLTAAQKGGIASGLARQSPKLIADKAKAVELHLAGNDTGQIHRILPHRHRNEIRRWLIAKGIYKTLGRGTATKGKRRFNPTQIILAEYSSEFRQLRKTDAVIHWSNHPMVFAYKALANYYKNQNKVLARLRTRYVNTSEHTRIKKLLSSRIHKAITRNGNGARKAARTMELIGCTITEIRVHLESKFAPGMTWKNCGRNGWHIDHIRPCDSFNLEDPDEQRKCFHFTNLQPLWEANNISKSNFWRREQK